MQAKADILVVEDETLVAAWIAEVLERLGYTVASVCGRGEDAMAVARTMHLDLALMDIRLKGELNGIEVATRLREERGTPVIFLSAHADAETVERVVETAPYGYLVKPFDERALSGAVQTAFARIRLERQLEAQERFLHAVLMAIDDGVVAAGPEGQTLLINPVAERLTGWRSEDGRGRPWKELVQVEEPAVRGEVDPLAQVLGRSNRERGRIVVGRDGRRRPVELCVERYGAASQPTGEVIVLRDLTQRLAVEESLRRSERLNATGRLLWNLAHEVRNPLFGLSSTLELLEDELGPDSPHVSHLGRLRDGIERLIGLADRIHALDHEVRPLPVALVARALADSAIHATVEVAAARSVSLVNDVPADLPAVRGREDALVRMLGQVLLNAVEHSDPGGVVTLSARTEDGLVVLEVADDGPGFDDELRERAFDPFFSTRPGATGLGLTQARWVVEEHGGQIAVANRPTGGAWVQVRLPATIAEPA